MAHMLTHLLKSAVLAHRSVLPATDHYELNALLAKQQMLLFIILNMAIPLVT